MTTDEKREALIGITSVMREIQQLAERLAGYVLALEASGMDLPDTKRTAQIMAEVALGWAAGAPGVLGNG